MKKSKLVGLWIGVTGALTSVVGPFVSSAFKPLKSNNNVSISKENDTISTYTDPETVTMSLSGKYIAATELSTFVSTNYPTGIEINGANTENVFSDMDKKFPQEFSDSQPSIGVYAPFAKAIFKKMVIDHPRQFIDGIPTEFTDKINESTFWVAEPNFDYVADKDDPNKSSGDLKIESTILFDQTFNGKKYYYRGTISVTITGMLNGQTTVNSWAANEFRIPAGNPLANCIPDDVIKPDANPNLIANVKDLIKENLHNILSNIPLTTELVPNDSYFSISQNESSLSSVDLRFAINKYSNDKGKIVVDKYVVGTKSDLKKITLHGFLTPRNQTTPKTLSDTQLNAVTGVEGTQWENISSKYANDFVNNTKYNKEAVKSIETIINNPVNRDYFFNNPVTDTKSLPIVQPGSLSLDLVKNSDGTTFDYSKVNINGKFISYSKNPNVEITDESYIPMTITIGGFRTKATTVREPRIFSVADDPTLSRLIPAEVVSKGTTALLNFLNTNVNNGIILEGNAQDSEVTITNPSRDIQVNTDEDTDRITVTFHVNLTYNNIGAPVTTGANDFTVTLNGFTRPNDKHTAGKTVDIKVLAARLGDSINESIIKGLSLGFAAVVSPTVKGESNFNNIREAFIESINKSPSLYFDNPVTNRDTNNDGVTDGKDLPIIKAGTSIDIQPAFDPETKKETWLKITGTFLCLPDNKYNPLDPVRDYHELTITLTGFKDGKTQPNPIPFEVTRSDIKKILVGDAYKPDNAEAIQQYINADDNLTRILDNALSSSNSIRTSATIAKDNIGQYLIVPVPGQRSAIQVTLTVSNYINELCAIETTETTTINVIITGFDSAIAEATTAKQLTAYNLSGAINVSFPFFTNIQNRMAVDFLSVGSEINTDTRKGWGAKGVEFVTSLVDAINANPSIFFANPVSTTDAAGRPYVKNTEEWKSLVSTEKYPDPSRSPLTVELQDGFKTSLKITGQFLVRPAKLSDPIQYDTRTIIISGFNSLPTELNKITPTVADYVYNDGKNEIRLENETAQTFLNRDRVQQGQIIVDYINSKMGAVEGVFKNVSFDTECKTITAPTIYISKDTSDPKNNRSIVFSVTLQYYSEGDGRIQTNNRITKEYNNVVITGFKAPNENKKTTQPKLTLNADNLWDKFSTETGYSTIKDIGKYYVASFDSTNGYLGSEFKSDLVSAINNFPEFFFDNSIEPSMNKDNLPIVKPNTDGTNEISIKAKYPTSENNTVVPELEIDGYFLCQPDIEGNNATQNDYKHFTFSIANGSTQNFLLDHPTKLNSKNANNSSKDVFNISDSSKFLDCENTDLNKFTLDDIINDRAGAEAAVQSFVQTYRGELFVNITKERTAVKNVKLEVENSDISSKTIGVKVNLIGYTDTTGTFVNTISKQFALYITGFKEPEMFVQSNNDKTLLMYAAVGSGFLGVLLIVFIILYRRNIRRKRKIVDNQFDSFY